MNDHYTCSFNEIFSVRASHICWTQAAAFFGTLISRSAWNYLVPGIIFYRQLIKNHYRILIWVVTKDRWPWQKPLIKKIITPKFSHHVCDIGHLQIRPTEFRCNKWRTSLNHLGLNQTYYMRHWRKWVHNNARFLIRSAATGKKEMPMT